MTILIIIIIIISSIYCFKYLVKENEEKQEEKPAKLLDLNTTTVAERQHAYHHGFRQQLQYDELQRRAESTGDTATLEAIRLGTYDGPLPPLKEDTPILAMSQQNGNPDAPIQNLEHFCIKDKGYHVSVWPKDQSQFDIIEFNIAGISHRDNIDNYLGEFVGTLEPEPTNAYDPNAIKILAPDGHHVGYVPADMTSEVRSVAALPCPCYCYIGCNTTTYFSDCYIFRNN